MTSSKAEYQRIADLTHSVTRELSGYLLNLHVKVLHPGTVDVPLFGLRFKFVLNGLADDHKYRIVNIVSDADNIDTESMFMALCESGYLHWLRNQISTTAFFKVLSQNSRWEKLIERALEIARERKYGSHILEPLKNIRKKGLMEIYHQDPTIFDWIVK